MQRLLIRAPNWLGDAVMALPAMEAVRAAHRDAEIVVAAPAGLSDLFHEQTGAAPHKVIALDRAREIEQLRGAGADAILLLPNSFGSAWVARRAGIAERWGYAASGRSFLMTRAVACPRGRVHQVEYYLALARGLGFATASTPYTPVAQGFSPARDTSGPDPLTGSGSPRALPRGERAALRRSLPWIAPSPESTAAGARVLEQAGVTPDDRLVAFAPGAAYGTAKRWPPDRVAQVVSALGVRRLLPVLVGALADRATGRAIESSLPPATRLVNLIGRTTLRQLVGVIARSAAFVSNDSGAMHIAAALGVPLIAIFGPTDERVTSPAGEGPMDVLLRPVFCRPCMLRECPIDHRCMKRIHVEDVLASFGRVSGS